MYIKVTEEMVNKMVKLEREGYTRNAIAAELGINNGTVRKYLGLKTHTVEPTRTRNEKIDPFKVGQKLRVEIKLCNTRNHLKGEVTKGNVIFSSHNYFTIQKKKDGKNLYPASFRYADIITKNIEVEAM